VIRDEEGSMRRLSGIVSRSDLLDSLLGARSLKGLEARRDRPVASLLRAVEPLSPGEHLADAARRLVNERLPALPVADARGRVIGILSLADVLARTDRGMRPTHPW
jgi:CBS-domain-containing membrane protein